MDRKHKIFLGICVFGSILAIVSVFLSLVIIAGPIGGTIATKSWTAMDLTKESTSPLMYSIPFPYLTLIGGIIILLGSLGGLVTDSKKGFVPVFIGSLLSLWGLIASYSSIAYRIGQAKALAQIVGIQSIINQVAGPGMWLGMIGGGLGFFFSIIVGAIGLYRRLKNHGKETGKSR